MGLRAAAGTVLELSRNQDGSWTETVLHSFTVRLDGGNLLGGLIFDNAAIFTAH